VSWALFLHHARLRLKERMEYRAAFLLGLFAQIIGYGAGYLVLWLTLQRFQIIGGWNWPEIAFLYSLQILTYAIGAAFTYSPMVELEKMVQQGNFDPVLIRPLDPFMALTAQMFNIGYLSHVLLSGSILVWSVNQLEVSWTPLNVVFLLISIISGSLIQATILTFIGSWTMIIVRADSLFNLAYHFLDFVRYPITIFGVGIQVFLTLVVPFALTNFYPAALILGKDTGVIPREFGWLVPAAGPVIMYLAYRRFNSSINKYQGAGG
jgi:ABC-2 type transport system permease protein